MADIESSILQVPTSLDEAPAWLVNTAQQLEEQLENLARAVANLHAEWTGASSDASMEVQQLWDKDAKALFAPEVGVLGQIAKAVRAVADNYALGEQFNVRTWSQF